MAALLMLLFKNARADEVYHDETRAYMGLQWIFEGAVVVTPNFVLGIRHTRSRTNDIVTGIDMSFAVSLDTLKPDAIRISYLESKCSFIGQFGLGYSFSKQDNMVFAGVVGPFSKVSAEINSGKNLAAGLELNTQDCAGKVVL